MGNKLNWDYLKQKANAKVRAIEFRLTYDEWFAIWTASGHFNERGRKKGQYVMSRYGDIGPYEVGNVFIQTTSQNLNDSLIKVKNTPEHKEQVRKLGQDSGRPCFANGVEYPSLRAAAIGENISMWSLRNRISKNVQGYYYKDKTNEKNN